MVELVDFELEIDRVGEKYRAKVHKSPAGRGARSDFVLPSGEELEGFRREIDLYRSRHLKPDAPPRLTAEELGRRLFDAVFTGKVLELWRSSLDKVESRLRLRLRLEEDSRLLSVPWELLFDGQRGRPVAIDRPVVRSLEIQSPREPLVIDDPLRILTVLSSPPGVPRLEVDEEWSALDQVLGQKATLGRIQPSRSEIDRALRESEWHVLHFVGHGDVDEKGGMLILEGADGGVRALDHVRLGTILDHPSLRLIVLNACDAARPGSDDPFSGVAQTLVRQKVPAVVAMQQVISDGAAIAFARRFYAALAERIPVDVALLEARQELYGEHEAEWFVPVLYLSTRDGDLFKRPQAFRSPWPRVAAVVAATALLIGGTLWSVSRQEPERPPAEKPPPRGSSLNPPECPSPEGLDMAFVKVGPGLFQMGQEGGAKDDEPTHQVRISRAFCVGVYEVTQEQWERVMSKTAPTPEDRFLPARRITFEGAQEFVRRLNQEDPARPYRLLTEAEWEFVARAGTKTPYSFGDDAEGLRSHANCGGHGDGYAGPAPVGQFLANDWGVHDLYGNVYEWVSGSPPYQKGTVTDPRGPDQGTKRIRRGGSWESRSAVCSSAARSEVNPSWKRQENGFRIVREIR